MFLKKNITVFVFPVLGAFLVDQISKILIVNSLTLFEPPTNIIGSFIRFKLAYNPYGVFSIPFGPAILYYIFQIIGILILSYIGLSAKNRINVIVFGLIIGGAIGNLFDRIRVDYVIDFIDMGIGDIRWFTYNLADAFITVGALFLLGREVFCTKQKREKTSKCVT